MDYEFSESENKVIGGIVTAARVSAGCLFALGILKTVASVRVGSPTGLVFLIFSGLLGMYLLRVGTAFDKIIKTEDNDIIHLTDAFRQLGVIFRGIRNAQIFLLVIMALSLTAGIVKLLSSMHG